jgi:hypothetical protein
MTTATAPEIVPEVTAAPTAPPAPATSTTPILSILALVSSLSGIVFGMVFPLSIIGIVLGVLGVQREPKARTMAIWSIVLGALPFALGVLFAAVGLAFAVPFGLFWAFGGF